MKKIVVTAGLVALTAAGAANAGEKNPSKEESIGVVSGLAIGAAAAGPFGAIAGMALGAWVGDRMERQRETIGTLNQRLGEASDTLAALNIKLVESERSVAQLTSQLADSERRVALLQAPEGSTVSPALQRTLRGEVMFRTKGTALNAATSAHLMELGEILAMTPDAVVQLDAYADPRGPKDENLALSEQRAEAVRASLVAGGLSPERIQITAYGEHETVAEKGDADGYALERKVVITIGSTQTTVAQTE